MNHVQIFKIFKITHTGTIFINVPCSIVPVILILKHKQILLPRRNTSLVVSAMLTMVTVVSMMFKIPVIFIIMAMMRQCVAYVMMAVLTIEL